MALGIGGKVEFKTGHRIKSTLLFNQLEARTGGKGRLGFLITAALAEDSDLCLYYVCIYTSHCSTEALGQLIRMYKFQKLIDKIKD